MDDIDLDYEVQELKDEGSKVPKWLKIISRIILILVIVGIGITMLFLLSGLVSWIADMTYTPSEVDLSKPADPYQIFELPESFKIQIIEEGMEQPSEKELNMEARKGDIVKIVNITSARENKLRKDFVKINILASPIEGWVPPETLKPINNESISIGIRAEIIQTTPIKIGEKEKDKKVNITIGKTRLAYDRNNTELPPVINTKGPNIGRIIRDTILKQRIVDLLDTKTRESIVYEAIILNINKFLMGIEQPIDELIDKKVNIKPGDEVKILDVYPDREPYDSSTFVKIRILSTTIEGWVPIDSIRAGGTEDVVVRARTKVVRESEIQKGKKVGGYVSKGIVDIYFPKGFEVYPLYKRFGNG